jgi:hypothetical protein
MIEILVQTARRNWQMVMDDNDNRQWCFDIASHVPEHFVQPTDVGTTAGDAWGHVRGR